MTARPLTRGSKIGQCTSPSRTRAPRSNSAGTEKSGIVSVVNDGLPAPRQGRVAVVRPRDAASLILLRGEGRALEVLAGRRPLDVKFMPGVYVFPGGAIDPPDRIAWSIESRTEALGAKLARSARAALRETWEEAGILVGRAGGAPPHEPAVRPIEQAYLGRGLVAAMDVLTYVGRAITPSHSFRRFNTRFFLCDGRNVHGEPVASEELEDVGWHPVGREV